MRDYRATQLGLDEANLDALTFDVDVEPEPVTAGGKDSSAMTSAVGAGLGGLMGFAMYIVIFIYGSMVMKSVMEEKTTRIVEVMISSVKPFQLMMGKVIGVGLVGLTQVGIWLVLIPIAVTVAGAIFGFDGGGGGLGGAAPRVWRRRRPGWTPTQAASMMEQLMIEIEAINWWAILPLFVMYFIGGYFVYASLFAAVGLGRGPRT